MSDRKLWLFATEGDLVLLGRFAFINFLAEDFDDVFEDLHDIVTKIDEEPDPGVSYWVLLDSVEVFIYEFTSPEVAALLVELAANYVERSGLPDGEARLVLTEPARLRRDLEDE